jgi:hypothetical protein
MILLFVEIQRRAVRGERQAGFLDAAPGIWNDAILYHESFLASMNIKILTMQENLHLRKILAKD